MDPVLLEMAEHLLLMGRSQCIPCFALPVGAVLLYLLSCLYLSPRVFSLLPFQVLSPIPLVLALWSSGGVNPQRLKMIKLLTMIENMQPFTDSIIRSAFYLQCPTKTCKQLFQMQTWWQLFIFASQLGEWYLRLYAFTGNTPCFKAHCYGSEPYLYYFSKILFPSLLLAVLAWKTCDFLPVKFMQRCLENRIYVQWSRKQWFESNHLITVAICTLCLPVRHVFYIFHKHTVLGAKT